MDNINKPQYSTATSLTARQINRRIILNIVFKQQPISRADTARETGLQRSTVSLIVDELLREGWIVEGEYGRIPRGRRPIFLQVNSDAVGFYTVFLQENNVELSVSALNSECLWRKQLPIEDSSAESLRSALTQLRQEADAVCKRQIKGIGVAVNNDKFNLENVRAQLSEIFQVPVAVGNVALACAKWFLLCHKDAHLAKGHLVSLHVDDDISLAAVVGGRPVRGAHGRAVAELARCVTEDVGTAGGGTGQTISRAACVPQAISLAVAAYDPGVVLIAGNFGQDSTLAQELAAGKSATAEIPDSVFRLADTSNQSADVYRNGALGLILSHFLDECS